jgi:acyl dehydratase
MLQIANFASLAQHLNSEVAVTDYVSIDQQRIDDFARLTLDQQWIHTDLERARRESPFAQTIAHGFLTLALLGHFLESSVVVGGARLVVSCGLNAVRFMSPVPAGSRLRARVRLRECGEAREYLEATWRFTLEREGERLPVGVADWTVRYLS